MAELVIRVAANLQEFRQNFAENLVGTIDTTKGALASMSGAFDGSKIIAQANATQVAIERIGGISKLTTEEQARANKILEQALDKYTALGRDAPAGMQKLAADTKQADTATSGLSETVKTLAAGFAAMFTARAAFNFVQQTINEASALQDLSNQTHIGVETIQQLAGAMSEFGVDQDTLAKGLYKLSRGIAGGDESVAAGLHAMGMSLKDVQGLDGEQLFLKIEKGLSTLQGGLRDTTAAELFSGKLGAAMAGASEGIEGALGTWKRLNTVMSTESVAALDQYGESIARAQKGLGAIAANLLGPVAQGFNTLTDASQHGATKWELFGAVMKDWYATHITGTTNVGNLTKLLDDLNQKTDANAKSTRDAAGAQKEAAAAMDDHARAAKFMAALELDTAKPLLAWQIEYLQRLKDMGQLNEKNAAAIGVAANQLKQYQDRLAIVTDVMKEADATTKAWNDAIEHLHSETFKLAMEHEKEWREEQLRMMAQVNAGIMEALDVQIAYNKSIGLDAAGAIEVQDDALQKLTRRLAEIAQMHTTDEAKAILAAAAERDYTKALYEESAAITVVGHGVDDLSKQFTHGTDSVNDMTDAVYKFAAGLTATNEELSAFYDSIARGGGIGIPDTRTGSGAMGRGAQLALPSRDSGGRVEAGQPYYIGKKAQPELFVPDSAGTMYPAGSGGGGVNITVHVTQPLGSPAAIANAVGNAVMQKLRSQGVRLPGAG